MRSVDCKLCYHWCLYHLKDSLWIIREFLYAVSSFLYKLWKMTAPLITTNNTNTISIFCQLPHVYPWCLETQRGRRCMNLLSRSALLTSGSWRAWVEWVVEGWFLMCQEWRNCSQTSRTCSCTRCPRCHLMITIIMTTVFIENFYGDILNLFATRFPGNFL